MPEQQVVDPGVLLQGCTCIGASSDGEWAGLNNWLVTGQA